MSTTVEESCIANVVCTDGNCTLAETQHALIEVGESLRQFLLRICAVHATEKAAKDKITKRYTPA